ncbi:MAG: pyrrolo-quinoline quinone [Flavobacteriales bacterium MED-G15]|nr:MAG: pyrrolo-quinoline quinone [Flavobacteriales bacterium MED-G15]
MKTKTSALLFIIFVIVSCNRNKDWNAYLGDQSRSHYSDLKQINSENVGNLELAWEYESGKISKYTQIQCNPLVINGVLYGTNPALELFAIDAETGAELWKFSPHESGQTGFGVNRGLIFWEDGSNGRIIYAAWKYLYAVDAVTGALETSFGEQGKIDLRKGLGKPYEQLSVIANTPGAVYKNILVQGTRVHESAGASPGHVRAYDLNTGEIVWRFNTVPHPGEYGYDTWPKDAWKRIGGANSWSGMSMDEKTGIVYIPTGSASPDFYGGNRKGKNLFANSLLAIDALTGERIWHYQFVHHDLWDRDLPAPPNLISINVEGETIAAVAQVTKSGHIFVFDRADGKLIFPVEEKPFPPSELVGEEAWPTQPLPTKIPPIARQEFTREMISDSFAQTKAMISWGPNGKTNAETLVEKFDKLTSAGQFIPPDKKGVIVFPGFDGGAEWGGAAFDPNSGIMYVNANEMPWVLKANKLDFDSTNPVINYGAGIYQQHCARCHGINRNGGVNFPDLRGLNKKYEHQSLQKMITAGRGAMMGFPNLTKTELTTLSSYLLNDYNVKIADEKLKETGRKTMPYSVNIIGRFLNEDGYPAVAPPWGTLNAVDLNKGEILWKVPLGEYEELTKKGFPKTGTENYGGPIVTAGNLIFIGATNDGFVRAFHKETGAELWKYKLPAGGYATPITYKKNGKQYVVIACGGGKMGTPSGNKYVAFRLKD